MATYEATMRTNYFRVTDEEKYNDLYAGLVGDAYIEDFTKTENGIIYHGFGTYGSIDWITPETREDDDPEYDFDMFINKLREILPDDECFVYIEAGNEKLRYITGLAIVATKNEVRSFDLDGYIDQTVKDMLGPDAKTTYVY